MTVMPEQATAPNVPTPDAVKKRPRRRIDLRQYGILAALAVIILLFQILTEGACSTRATSRTSSSRTPTC